jgi:hypothetical protein
VNDRTIMKRSKVEERGERGEERREKKKRK